MLVDSVPRASTTPRSKPILMVVVVVMVMVLTTILVAVVHGRLECVRPAGVASNVGESGCGKCPAGAPLGPSTPALHSIDEKHTRGWRAKL